MKGFTFRPKSISNTIMVEDNRGLFKFRVKAFLGFFSLITPIMKEVTYSKGPTVRYRRHVVYGIGKINANKEFSGLAFFDPHIRMLIFAIILLGTAYVSLDIFTSIFFAVLYYLLVLFLSYSEDDTLLYKCKLMFETTS